MRYYNLTVRLQIWTMCIIKTTTDNMWSFVYTWASACISGWVRSRELRLADLAISPMSYLSDIDFVGRAALGHIISHRHAWWTVSSLPTYIWLVITDEILQPHSAIANLDNVYHCSASYVKRGQEPSRISVVVSTHQPYRPWSKFIQTHVRIRLMGEII